MGHEGHDTEALALDALGALDGGEREALVARLSSCPECRREHDELRRVSELLAYGAPPAAPPPALRARLLERLREEGPAEHSEGGAGVSRAGGDAEPGRVLRPSPERFTRSSPSPWTRAVAYGALAASVVLAASLFLVLRENRAARAASERLAAELREEREELARARAELARGREELARERETAELLASPGVRMTSLAGTPDMPGARASLAYDRTTGRVVIFATGLPAPPAGKAYQMWYIAGGKILPGGVFKSDASGRASATDQVPSEGRDAAGFAVTLEPEGGVPRATGSILLKSAS